MEFPKTTFLLLTLLALSVVAAPVWSEDSDKIVSDENALFGSSDDTTAATEDDNRKTDNASMEESLFSESTTSGDSLVTEIASVSGIENSLLTSSGVEIGGRYGFSATANWLWNDPALLAEHFGSPDLETAAVDLRSTLYFDARPNQNFRVFGKATIRYPFATDGGTSDGGGAAERRFEDVFHVEELFSDINWNEVLFLRGGKHRINWGVGYFFSPADILNVTRIDPENPEADREGPVSIKAHVPFAAHNVYLYLIANNIDTWDDIGIAPKVELVFGSMELGIGGLYQKVVGPAAMLTASFPVWDVDFFGEAVLRYGSDRTFVEASESAPFGVNAVERDDEVFYNLTAGVSYNYSFDDVDSSVNVIGQYFYNGEGYENPSILSGNPVGVGALLGSGALKFSDLMNTGRHYAAVSSAWNGIFGTEFALRIFWMHNFSESSGYITPALSLTPFDGMNLSLQVAYRYGEIGDEYTPTGDTVSATISMSLGGGSF